MRFIKGALTRTGVWQLLVAVMRFIKGALTRTGVWQLLVAVMRFIKGAITRTGVWQLLVAVMRFIKVIIPQTLDPISLRAKCVVAYCFWRATKEHTVKRDSNFDVEKEAYGDQEAAASNQLLLKVYGGAKNTECYNWQGQTEVT